MSLQGICPLPLLSLWIRVRYHLSIDLSQELLLSFSWYVASCPLFKVSKCFQMDETQNPKLECEQN